MAWHAFGEELVLKEAAGRLGVKERKAGGPRSGCWIGVPSGFDVGVLD